MKCRIIIPINRQGRRHEFIASTVVQINNLLLSGDHVRTGKHDNNDLILNKENIKVAIVDGPPRIELIGKSQNAIWYT